MKKKKTDAEYIEFVPADGVASSDAFIKTDGVGVEPALGGTLSADTKLDDMPPVFRELAVPKLPELPKANRARLLMQSPNRIFFYWSVGSNPFYKLHKALGTDTSGYTLVLKLIDLDRDTERVYPVDAEGSWWFDVEADGKYRAEIGFYAPNRPYVRALYSNTIETPRKAPSPRVDTEADWAVSADRFARVLEVSGFEQDAFEVAIAGDDLASSERATHSAFEELVDDREIDLGTIAAEEIRHVLLLLAAGVTLDELRSRISAALFAMLQAYADRLSSERALQVLKDRFEIEATEFTEEEFEPAVFGASVVNFPKKLKTRRTLPKLNPVSSRPTSGGATKNR